MGPNKFTGRNQSYVHLIYFPNLVYKNTLTIIPLSNINSKAKLHRVSH